MEGGRTQWQRKLSKQSPSRTPALTQKRRGRLNEKMLVSITQKKIFIYRFVGKGGTEPPPCGWRPEEEPGGRLGSSEAGKRIRRGKKKFILAKGFEPGARKGEGWRDREGSKKVSESP